MLNWAEEVNASSINQLEKAQLYLHPSQHSLGTGTLLKEHARMLVIAASGQTIR